MTALSLASFEETMDALKYWVKPLVEEDDNHCVALIDEFSKSSEAKYLYHTLQEYCQNSDDWIFEMMSKRFLYNHKSLPITSNVTLKVDWRTTQTGLKKIAHFVNAFLQIHVRHLKGENVLPDCYADSPDVKNKLLRFLSGGTRRPSMPCDELYFNENAESAEKSIVVLYRGYAWKINVIDERFGVANPAQIENVLYELLQITTNNADMPFTVPSVIDSQLSIDIRKQLLCRDENHKIMQIIDNSLFVLSLDSNHYNDEEEALFESSYGQGSQVWAYKPVNFIYHVADNRIFAQIECSSLDVDTMNELLILAKSIDETGESKRQNLLKTNLGVKAINWTIDGKKIANEKEQREMEGTYKMMTDALQEYQYSSEKWFISLHDVFITDEEEKKLGEYDRNAMCQLLLQYAQYATYQTFSSMVEYMGLKDSKGYHYDYLPQLTLDSQAFVKKLYARQATISDFEQVIATYGKRKYVAGKEKGLWQSWLALRYIADNESLDLAIFKDPTIEQVINPFLCSFYLKSVMVNQVVIPPYFKKGFGVFCFNKRNHFNFVITHPRHHINEINLFSKSINSGLKRILQLLADN